MLTLLDKTLCGQNLHLVHDDLVVALNILLIPADLANDYREKKGIQSDICKSIPTECPR